MSKHRDRDGDERDRDVEVRIEMEFRFPKRKYFEVGNERLSSEASFVTVDDIVVDDDVAGVTVVATVVVVAVVAEVVVVTATVMVIGNIAVVVTVYYICCCCFSYRFWKDCWCCVDAIFVVTKVFASTDLVVVPVSAFGKGESNLRFGGHTP